MLIRNSSMKSSLGFTIVELMIVVAIIAILGLIAVPTFVSYKQKASLAACFATAHSIHASIITWAATTKNGTFPQPQQCSSWDKMSKLCNMNGSTLPASPESAGFQNWISYYPIDTDFDNQIDEFYLLLRINSLPRTTIGSQIQISHFSILKQTY